MRKLNKRTIAYPKPHKFSYTHKLLIIILISLCELRVYAQNSNAEVVDYKETCLFEKSKVIKTTHITVQINDRAGEEYGNVAMYYSKSEKLSDVAIRLEDQNGNIIRTVGKNEINDQSAISEGSLYEDTYVKKVLVKHSMYPYRVSYSYTTTYKNYTEIGHWSPVVFKDVPTLKATFKVVIPKDIEYKVAFNGVAPFQKELSGNNIELTWHSDYIKQVKNENFSLPENFYPYVVVTPTIFNYGIEGESKSWETFGKWYSELTKDLDILPDGDKAEVHELITGINDKKEIVRKLYHYLQDHTRYINVSIGIGGLKPYPASYVSQNRYGDCKALTTYMKSLLKAAGIESFYTLVWAGQQPKELIRDAVFPQFNHVILAVPLNQDTIWLENTQNTSPLGYLGTFTQNRDGLLVNNKESKIVHIPSMPLPEVTNVRSLTFNMTSAENITVAWASTFKGEDFDMFNQINSDLNDETKDRLVREYIPFNNYEVVNWNIKKYERDSSSIGLSAYFNVYKYLKKLGEGMYFSLYPIKLPQFSKPANRTLPLHIPYPVSNVDTLIYYYPAGYTFKGEITKCTLNTPFGNYSRVLYPGKEKLIVVKKVEIFAGRYSLSQYPEFYKFIAEVKENDNLNILLAHIN